MATGELSTPANREEEGHRYEGTVCGVGCEDVVGRGGVGRGLVLAAADAIREEGCADELEEDNAPVVETRHEAAGQ